MINAYTCTECEETIVTVDADEGVTPMMIDCRATDGCEGMMRSHFYAVIQAREPTHEWHKPLKSKMLGLSAEMRSYVKGGGLVLYKRSTEDD